MLQMNNTGGAVSTFNITGNDLQINATADLILQNSGANVGIGTDNPSEKLHVYRHSTNYFIVANQSQLRANTSGIGFEIANTDSVGTALRVGTSTTAPSLLVKGSNGNVGIGTNNPNSPIPMGAFTQDYEYVDGLGDLDQCNGRYGVTPEFPDGIYYYVVTDNFPFFTRCLKGDF